MNEAMTEFKPAMGFLFILLIVGAVGLTLLLQGRWRAVLIGGIIALLLVGFIVPFKLRHRAAREHAEEARALRAAVVLQQAQIQNPGGRLRIQADPPVLGPLYPFDVPDDVAAWKRDSNLGFRVLDPWNEEEVSEEDLETTLLKTEVVGDTRFTYFEPSINRKLIGLSDKEATPDAALEGARDAAKRKLAALALIEIERDDPRFDVKAAERLARRLAGNDAPKYGSWREEDTYQEYATRPYGTLYRAAVCVKADESYIERLATSIRREVASGAIRREREFRSWVLFTGAALLGGVVIFLLYTLVNAGTKGYFAWPLRGAALAFFAVMVLGALYLARGGGTGFDSARYEVPPTFLPSPAPGPAR